MTSRRRIEFPATGSTRRHVRVIYRTRLLSQRALMVATRDNLGVEVDREIPLPRNAATCQRQLKMGHDHRVKMGQVVGTEP